eukprot:6698196-Lingulodinium_polyedra.AAC.1
MLAERSIATNITKEDDFTQQSAFAKVWRSLTGPRDVLFYCSLCTGGCPWQRINRAKAIRR